MQKVLVPTCNVGESSNAFAPAKDLAKHPSALIEVSNDRLHHGALTPIGAAVFYCLTVLPVKNLAQRMRKKTAHQHNIMGLHKKIFPIITALKTLYLLILPKQVNLISNATEIIKKSLIGKFSMPQVKDDNHHHYDGIANRFVN